MSSLKSYISDNPKKGDDEHNKMCNVEEVINFSEEIDNAKNKKSVHCQFCNSIMLKPQSGKYLETQVRLKQFVYIYLI